ncbi:MAG: hypothetical protein BHW37_01755 [Firmicutes bacterium CAG:272_52_7]|nr:MAG: hypothetical protein BHW37_01755 [Firmicutes bacterium CAG:272_52_7]
MWCQYLRRHKTVKTASCSGGVLRVTKGAGSYYIIRRESPSDGQKIRNRPVTQGRAKEMT